MCSRFRSIEDLTVLYQMFQVDQGINFEFNPNVAPTNRVPIVRADKKERSIALAHFGLVPPWAKDTKGAARMINARMETVREKPVYKKPYEARRCVIPAQGFYEWKEEDGRKQPYYFSRKDGKILLLAGLWEQATIEGEKLVSFTILTGEPNAVVKPYHDRMPVALEDPLEWLDMSWDPLNFSMDQVPSLEFSARPMNPVMNKPQVKDLATIEAL